MDGAAATTGAVTLTGISAGGNVTVSMGAGAGSLTMARLLLRLVYNRRNFGGAVDATVATALAR